MGVRKGRNGGGVRPIGAWLLLLGSWTGPLVGQTPAPAPESAPALSPAQEPSPVHQPASAPPPATAQEPASATPPSPAQEPPQEPAPAPPSAQEPAPPPAPSPPQQPRATTREWLNRHLSLRAHLLLPAAALRDLEAPTGEGVWTQPAAGLSLTFRPWTRLFGTLTLMAYPRYDEREAWVPDFTYAFGYDDWRANSLFLIHANYTATRYPWWRDADHPIARPLHGVTSAGWRYRLPRALWDRLHLPSSLWMGGAVAVSYALRYDRLDGQEGSHALNGSLSFSVSYRSHWFAEMRAFLYPIPGQQQPWDPDFTYSFGYMDWRPWRVGVRWNNYAGNRWPGRSQDGNGGILAGALVIDLGAGF